MIPADDTADFETKVPSVMKKLPGQQAPQAALEAINAALIDPFDDAGVGASPVYRTATIGPDQGIAACIFHLACLGRSHPQTRLQWPGAFD